MSKKRRWYYVSFYQEFPVYEPAEGGYYVPENVLQFHYRYGSLKRARKEFKRILEESKECYQPFDIINKNSAYSTSDYIGRGSSLHIETKLGVHQYFYEGYR